MNRSQLSRLLDSLQDRELVKLKEIYAQTGQHKKEALIDSEMEKRAEVGSDRPTSPHQQRLL